MFQNKQFKIEELLSNEALAKFLNSLEWEWGKIYTNKGQETAYFYEVDQKSVILSAFLKELTFNLDSYYYVCSLKSITRTGPKVKKPNPVSKFIKSLVRA